MPEFDPMDVLGQPEPKRHVSKMPPAPPEPNEPRRVPCPVCRELILATAAKCRFCGESLKAAGSDARKGSGTKIVAWLVFFVAFFFIVGLSARYAENRRKDWKGRDNSDEAFVVMERFVTDGLKSPSTATFADRGDELTYVIRQTDEPTQYEVRSWVDSQNGFGAMIRTQFTGVVKQTDYDSWDLISLDTVD